MDGTLAITGDANPVTDHACGMCHRGIAREGICTVCFNIGIAEYFGMPVTTHGEIRGHIQELLDAPEPGRDATRLIDHTYLCLQNCRALELVDHVGWRNHGLENASCPGCGQRRGGEARCSTCKSTPGHPWYVATSAQYADICSVLADAWDHNLRPKSVTRLAYVLDFLNEMYVVDTEGPDYVPESHEVLVRSIRSYCRPIGKDLADR